MRKRLRDRVYLDAQRAYVADDPAEPTFLSGWFDVVDWVYGSPGARDVLFVSDQHGSEFSILGDDLPGDYVLYV